MNIEHQLKELTRAEEAAERLSAEYEKKLLLLQQKESLELVKVSITSRRQDGEAGGGRGGQKEGRSLRLGSNVIFLSVFFQEGVQK